ncbi:class I SAM-dependent methyltransferase [Rubinisphaera sp.]|uniref:class I SAM-dependent methyltransferase n=1 Tax=Rubinisphaera sp. TaxID=2024857 RepID=UPI000C0D4676|nr:class I SAM-dependent methyltransferase [Rubinisphaera sp.]MBV09226.1 SAM-dependent methyltransferase [Rubinisphaera sp.]HCS54661.1 SAM-dependent methyltransferase [Planctomycetaceae bacterium]|tara:strand:+ start:7197 stop:7964 length:768 start_codon:yes stop_codon:yes gene_type:complete
MAVDFTAHNIRLDDGSFTIGSEAGRFEEHAWLQATKRLLATLYPSGRDQIRIADLGCLEGGYAVEFARMGFSVLGLEVRESNMEACRYVKSKTDLPLLEFVKDDAWNIAQYGEFDVMFCCGLFYHIDRPREFLKLLSNVTRQTLILQTHFSAGVVKNDKFKLSPMEKHEGLPGQWYQEYASQKELNDRESAKWASWDNYRSFWIQREALLGEIKSVGFDLVFEQFDSLGADIADQMLSGRYVEERRGTFVGIKSA